MLGKENLGESHWGILTLVCVSIILLGNLDLGELYYLFYIVIFHQPIRSWQKSWISHTEIKANQRTWKITWIHPWSLTARRCKMLVGRRSFPYREDIFFTGRAFKHQSEVLPQICKCKSCGDSHHHLVILQHLSTAKDFRHHHGFRSESLTCSIITITASSKQIIVRMSVLWWTNMAIDFQ